MEMKEILRHAFSKPICDNCLGRIFAQLLTGFSNAERGRILRAVGAFLLETGEIDQNEVEISNFRNFKFNYRKELNEAVKRAKAKKCHFCGNLFEHLDHIAKRIAKKLANYEFSNFLVGTKASREMIEREEELWKLTGIEYCEPIKAELNREIGKRVAEILKKEHELRKPEMVILLDWERGKPKITILPRSLYVFGYYQKLVRGIPQCRWGTPGKYRTSVEQIIGKPLLRAAKGRDTKFHGCGREDVDARCLAWRPFVIEIISPKRRRIDLRKIAGEINSTKGVRVKGLRIVDKEWVEKIKSAAPDKTYRAVVVLGKPVSEKELRKLKKLIGVINQRTPERVLHRRADKLRKREVKKISWKILSPNKIELTIKTSAGLYVKELVSGDNGRTSPSVAEILGTEARVEELDVIGIGRIR